LTVDSSSIDGNESNLKSSIPHPYPLQDGNNDQSNSLGGGLFLSDGSTVAISHSSISGNSITVSNPAGEPFGADVAFCACGFVDLTISDTRIERNSLTVNVLSSADTGPSGPTAFEIDGPASIGNTRIAHNTGVVTTPNGDAGALAAVLLINDGSVTPTVTDSEVSDNTSTANAPNGAATVNGGGLDVNGSVTITGTTIRGNQAVANGATGFAQGGGIWNGALFEPAGSALALLESSVTNNSVSGSAGVELNGGGLYTVGFPPTLTGTVVAHNAPDQCDGC
jgi:hypothetical protein